MAARTDAELARWRLRSLLLDGPRAATPVDVVHHLLAVQAENPTQSRWAIGCRALGATDDDVVADIDAGALVRTHVLRPTWHAVRPADLRWLLALSRPRIAMSMRQGDRAQGIDAHVVERCADVVAEELRGTWSTRDELGGRLGAAGLPSAGPALAQVLGHLEIDALVCSGPTTVDGVHTYALVDERVPATPPRDHDEAVVELAVRYVRGHGPVTDRDLAYWSHQTLTTARNGLSAGVEAGDLWTFEHDGRTWWAAGDEEAGLAPRQRGHVLQRLDEYHHGVQDTRHLVDLDGLDTAARPPMGMVLVDGQLAGNMWRRQRADELVVEVEPLRDLVSDDLDALAAEVARYGDFLGLPGRLDLVGSGRS